ncbi:hypothetical protein MMPV_001610 [Pyropia vietnamensis]
MASRPANGSPPTPAPWPPNPYAAGAAGSLDLCSSGASTPPHLADSCEQAGATDLPGDEGTASTSAPRSPPPQRATAGEEKPSPSRASSSPSSAGVGGLPAATDLPADQDDRASRPKSARSDAAAKGVADPVVTVVSSLLTTDAAAETPAEADPPFANERLVETIEGPPLPPRPSATAGFADSVMALREEVARLADGHARQTDLEDTVAALRREVAYLTDRADRTSRQIAADSSTISSLRREVTRLTSATARQAKDLDTMAAAQRGLAARSTNTGRSRMVWNSYRRARAGCPPWYTFLKEREGNGPLLPGVPPLDVPEVPVGAPLPAPFPTTYEAVTTLDDDDLAIICSWLHDTAGVTKGDPISTRRAKVMARLCWWG